MTEGEHAERGRPEEARVDTVKLSVEDTLKLGVLRRILAEGRRGRDTVDVQSVAWVLCVCNCVGNQRLCVGDASGLGEVDHGVRVHLLGARVRVGKEGVDAVDTCERYAGAVRDDVTAANDL